MTPENALDLVFRFVEHINRRDLSGLSALMSDDHVFIDLSGEEHRNKDDLVQGWHSYFTQFPDYMIHLAEVFVRDNIVVLIGRTTGSHTGRPRAEEFQGTIIWVAETHQGKLRSWRILNDNHDNRTSLTLSSAKRFA